MYESDYELQAARHTRLLPPDEAHPGLLDDRALLHVQSVMGRDANPIPNATPVVSPEGREPRSTSDRITLGFLIGDHVPLHLEIGSEQDVYILWAPLRRAEALWECDGRVLFEGTVTPGMLIMTSPGEHLRKVFRTPMRAAVIEYPGRLLRQKMGSAYQMAGAPYPFGPLLQPDSQVQRIVSALLSTDKFGPAHRQLFLDGLAYALLACLARKRANVPLRRRGQPRGLSDSEFARCVEYADARIAEHVELREWASVVGLSVADFARQFQSRTCQSPYAWIMNWRIDRSKDLLRSTGLPLADIALGVGFCSQSHFTEAFRRRVGLSPGRWRTQLAHS